LGGKSFENFCRERKQKPKMKVKVGYGWLKGVNEGVSGFGI